MSVVNRMLQDIDRRLGTGEADARLPHPEIRSVPLPPRAARRIGPVVIVAAFALPVVALLAWMAWQKQVVARAPAPAPVPVVVRAASATLMASIPAEAPAEPAFPVLAEEPKIERMAKVRPVVDAPAAAARRSLESFKLSLNLSAPATTIARVPPAKGAIGRIEVPVRHVAAEETVASARALWNEGSRASALSTLREALAAAEGARDFTAAAPIVREIARLEIADNRPQGALDLLRRLEEGLGPDADALALRGNAEQRLARHGEAAQSYLAALKLRPGEGRWMLGAAISLAAEGRADEARAWVERARERGAITPPIAAYLQQLGIAAR